MGEDRPARRCREDTGAHHLRRRRASLSAAGAAADDCGVYAPDDLPLLLDRAADVVFRYRLQPRVGFDYVSRAITRLTGFTPEELYADPGSLVAIAHPDDRPVVLDLLEHGPSSNDIVIRWRRKTGSV